MRARLAWVNSRPTPIPVALVDANSTNSSAAGGPDPDPPPRCAAPTRPGPHGIPPGRRRRADRVRRIVEQVGQGVAQGRIQDGGHTVDRRVNVSHQAGLGAGGQPLGQEGHRGTGPGALPCPGESPHAARRQQLRQMGTTLLDLLAGQLAVSRRSSASRSLASSSTSSRRGQWRGYGMGGGRGDAAHGDDLLVADRPLSQAGQLVGPLAGHTHQQ